MDRVLDIAPRTTFAIGGAARELIEARSDEALVEGVEGAPGGRVVVLGGGSNVLVADEGFDGRVVVVATRGVRRDDRGDHVLVTAAAGEPWGALVESVCDEGLTGVECLAGIPGLVGATPIQNVGAYGQEVSDTIVAVRAYDRTHRRVVDLEPSACGFGYRDSVFKSRFGGRFLVLEVTFALRRAAPSRPAYRELASALEGETRLTPRRVADVVVGLRRAKGMVVDPLDTDSRGAGSFFTNPVLSPDEFAVFSSRVATVMGENVSVPTFDGGEGRRKVAAGWLIERAGFAKGTTRGRAGVSSRHALALVNRGGASAREVIALAREIQLGVSERFGVWLTPEPVLVGFEGDPLARPQ